MKSILESENYDALHGRLYDGMHRFYSNKHIVIMICRSGRHRSVANTELWSNTLTRCSRQQHSVSLLHLSELDFGEYVLWKLFGTQQTVTQSFSSTLRSSPSRVLTTCSCARPGDRPLETTTTRTCGRSYTVCQGSPSTNSKKREQQVPLQFLLRRTRAAESSTN